jgi:hypothetical protein
MISQKSLLVLILLSTILLSVYGYESSSIETVTPTLDTIRNLFKKSKTHLQAIKPYLESPFSSPDVEQCNDSTNYHWYKFMGRTIASFTASGQHVTIETANCFKDTTISATFLGSSEIQIDFYAYKKKSIFCTDTYIITSLLNFELHSPIFEGHTRKIYKISSTQNEAKVIQNSGLKVMRMCESWVRLLPNLISTASLWLDMFMPKWVPKFLSKPILRNRADKNYEYAAKYLGASFPKLGYKLASFSPDMLKMFIRSGDVILTHGGTGFDAIILSTMGGPVSHSAIAMWEGTTLWIVEDDAGLGINKMKIEDWYKASVEGWNMVWLPLSEGTRKMFDVGKVWKWYHDENVEESPYGTSNAFYTSFDSKDRTFPLFTDDSNALFFLNLLSNLGLKSSINTFIADAINNRLGTSGLDLGQCIQEVAARKLDLSKVMAMPENPDWTYSGKKQLICSGMVVKF